ncbi:hypothetical protein niasHS_009092 [Heterodera schachtii]|uniref:Uncharacterized protein n=1 Tax=Heterodera schachtii TaxID=97005 RepID=A0ABD2J9G7_HETSC
MVTIFLALLYVIMALQSEMHHFYTICFLIGFFLHQHTEAIAHRLALNGRTVLKNKTFEAKLSSVLQRQQPKHEGQLQFQPETKKRTNAKNVLERLKKKGLIVDILPKGDGNRTEVINELKKLKLTQKN